MAKKWGGRSLPSLPYSYGPVQFASNFALGLKVRIALGIHDLASKVSIKKLCLYNKFDCMYVAYGCMYSLIMLRRSPDHACMHVCQ